MITTLVLSPELVTQIENESRAAFPYECCGLVEGRREEGQAIATALHPVPNLSTEGDRFELDPSAHLRLMREARKNGRAIIGCYHSHPNEMAQPSQTDAQGAGETDFLWLIAGVREGSVTLGIFVWTGGAFVPIIRQ